MGFKPFTVFVALLVFSLVIPSVSAWYGHDYWQPYTSTYSSVRESETVRISERESARSWRSYPYYYYGNDFSEFSRSRDFEFSRSYEAEYRSVVPHYGWRPYDWRDSDYDDHYWYGPHGWESYHQGVLPFGYGYYDP